MQARSRDGAPRNPVVGAKGPASGHATMILGARSSGAAAKATYAMKVKAAGGTAQVSRECRVF